MSKFCKYFLNDPEGNGFETFETEEKRDYEAKKAIDYYLDHDDGWGEGVQYITTGILTHYTVEADRVNRPPDTELDDDGYDKDGSDWSNNDFPYTCNYRLKEIVK